MLIGLCGYVGSGKDTVGKILAEKLGFIRLSFAEKLREAVYNVNPIVASQVRLGWNWAWPPVRPVVRYIRVQELVDRHGWDQVKRDPQYPEIRRQLQFHGTEGGRNIHGPDCWVKPVEEQIETEPDKNYVITDMRFPNELAMLERRGGHPLRVVRPCFGRQGDHISENTFPERNLREIDNDGSLNKLTVRVLDYVLLLKQLEQRACEKPTTSPESLPGSC